MNYNLFSPLLTFYGVFLISCGIMSVIFIGSKAKTALMSGGLSGILAIVAGWTAYAAPAGIFLSLALFIVFAWRSTLTLFKLLELVPTSSPEIKGKAIAFLIISLMAIVSIVVLILIVSIGGWISFQ